MRKKNTSYENFNAVIISVHMYDYYNLTCTVQDPDFSNLWFFETPDKLNRN